MLKIQIVNRTGKPYDTFVYDAKTGETLGGVVEIDAMKPSETNEVTLHIAFSQLDLYSEHVKIITECPHCKQHITLEEK